MAEQSREVSESDHKSSSSDTINGEEVEERQLAEVKTALRARGVKDEHLVDLLLVTVLKSEEKKRSEDTIEKILKNLKFIQKNPKNLSSNTKTTLKRPWMDTEEEEGEGMGQSESRGETKSLVFKAKSNSNPKPNQTLISSTTLDPEVKRAMEVQSMSSSSLPLTRTISTWSTSHDTHNNAAEVDTSASDSSGRGGGGERRPRISHSVIDFSH